MSPVKEKSVAKLPKPNKLKLGVAKLLMVKKANDIAEEEDDLIDPKEQDVGMCMQKMALKLNENSTNL